MLYSVKVRHRTARSIRHQIIIEFDFEVPLIADVIHGVLYRDGRPYAAVNLLSERPSYTDTESGYKSRGIVHYFQKAVTWRVIASIITFLLAMLFGLNVETAGLFAAAEAALKIAAFMVFDRYYPEQDKENQ